MDRRQNSRTQARLRVRMSFSTVETFADFYTRNISPGGMFIEYNTPKPEGTPVEIVLQPPEEVPIVLFGEVVRRSDSMSNPGMGIRVETITEESRRAFESVLGPVQAAFVEVEAAIEGERAIEQQAFARLREELERFLEETAEADAYTVLGISRFARAEEINAAYEKLSSRYNPLAALEETSPDLFCLFRRARNRLYDAYKTICDPKLREVHDASLGLVVPSGETFTPVAFEDEADRRGFFKEVTPTHERMAENLFKEGCVLLASGNRKAAAMKFKLAAHFDPTREDYRSKLNEAVV